MNVLYFTQIFYPFIFGGGEYVFFLMARELVKRGHSVSVITQRFKDLETFEVVEGIRIYRIGPGIVYRGTLPPTIRHNLDYLVRAIKKASAIITEEKKKARTIDVLHSNTYVPALCGQICSSFHHIPHIITFHDVYQASNKKFWKDWVSNQSANHSFYTSILSQLTEKIILKLPASAIHTVSEASRKDLLDFGVKNEKITVIPNGLNISEYQYRDLNRDTHEDRERVRNSTAVFIGRLVFYKNVETVIRAFKHVVKVKPEARLIIIGDGPHKDNLVKEAEPIKNAVSFKGRIPHSEKIKLIAESSFIVFPSVIEGFGITIIEGFACSKAVLVSNVRPQSDIVKNGYLGYVIPPFDVNAWANKIIELFDDKCTQERLGRNAYEEFLSNYEITTVISKIEMLYKAVQE
jgi:glycosyltransferase involved in cell wall biosynthesis